MPYKALEVSRKNRLICSNDFLF